MMYTFLSSISEIYVYFLLVTNKSLKGSTIRQRFSTGGPQILFTLSYNTHL